MLRTVNRVLLGLAGAVLLALGLAVLAAAADLPSRWGSGVGSGWPWQGGSDVLLSAEDRTRWRNEGWWWPVVLAALAALVLLALWWLLAQLRRRRLTAVLIPSASGDGGSPPGVLRGRALEHAIAADAESQPGVERAKVTLGGRRSSPRARVRLLLAPHAEPGPVLRRLHSEGLEHARDSVGVRELPAEVRLRSLRHRPERVN